MQEIKHHQEKERSSFLWAWAGVLLLILIWQIAAMFSGPLILATPLQTFYALGNMLSHQEFYVHCLISFSRVGIMVLCSALLGVLLAGAALWDRRAANMLEPLRRVFATLPPAVIAVVVMFWLGMGTKMIITFGGMILWPIMYVNLLEGSELCSAELRETARVFNISLSNRLRHFYLPAIAPSALAGGVQVLSSAIRVTILAEVLGADKGIGAAIVASARNLDVEQMTAWVFVVLVMAVAAEQILISPLRKRIYRWKKQ